jgi:acid phosphatase
LSQVKKLKQVQVLIRHGARTIENIEKCWINYNITWNNCNSTTLQIPSNSYTSSNIPKKWLFRKLYDGSPNDLGGNCETGQLIGTG